MTLDNLLLMALNDGKISREDIGIIKDSNKVNKDKALVLVQAVMEYSLAYFGGDEIVDRLIDPLESTCQFISEKGQYTNLHLLQTALNEVMEVHKAASEAAGKPVQPVNVDLIYAYKNLIDTNRDTQATVRGDLPRAHYGTRRLSRRGRDLLSNSAIGKIPADEDVDGTPHEELGTVLQTTVARNKELFEDNKKLKFHRSALVGYALVSTAALAVMSLLYAASPEKALLQMGRDVRREVWVEAGEELIGKDVEIQDLKQEIDRLKETFDEELDEAEESLREALQESFAEELTASAYQTQIAESLITEEGVLEGMTRVLKVAEDNSNDRLDILVNMNGYARITDAKGAMYCSPEAWDHLAPLYNDVSSSKGDSGRLKRLIEAVRSHVDDKDTLDLDAAKKVHKYMNLVDPFDAVDPVDSVDILETLRGFVSGYDKSKVDDYTETLIRKANDVEGYIMTLFSDLEEFSKEQPKMAHDLAGAVYIDLVSGYQARRRQASKNTNRAGRKQAKKIFKSQVESLDINASNLLVEDKERATLYKQALKRN